MRGACRATLAAALCLAVTAAAVSIASAAPPDRDGADLYRAKCGTCHRPYRPAEIERASWERYFPKMQKRAHLSAEETEAIRTHVEKGMAPVPAPAPAPSPS